MSSKSDRDTAFDLESKVAQNPALQTSLQNVHENEAIEPPRKRRHSPSEEKPDNVLNNGQRSLLKLKNDSPWNSYRKEFACELAGDAVAVVHNKNPSRVLLLRSYPDAISSKMLQWFSQHQHPHIMSAKEAYLFKNSLFIICEDLPLTMEYLIVCRAYPTEAQLAVIMRQILEGLSYLVTQGLEHQALKSSNILMNLDGIVKIDVQAQGKNKDQRATLDALKTITMELMEKHTKKNGTTGVNDLKRWPVDSNAVKFLAAIDSVSTVDELRKHQLLTQCTATEGELMSSPATIQSQDLCCMTSR
uniref:Serine/threonine-protein kinase CST20 n=1 Tax=Talaromyces marneffei PM1 TaxID=1077442 RepID=A0A093ULR8_TALMA